MEGNWVCWKQQKALNIVPGVKIIQLNYCQKVLEQSKQSIRTCISYPKGRWRRLLVAVLIRKTVGISPVFKFKILVTPFFDFKSPFLVLQLPRAEREHDTQGILSKCYPEPSEGFTSSSQTGWNSESSRRVSMQRVPRGCAVLISPVLSEQIWREWEFLLTQQQAQQVPTKCI